MSKPPAPEDRIESSRPQNYWIARILPILSVTLLTLALPVLLNHSARIVDLVTTPEQQLYQKLRSISVKIMAHGQTIGSGVLIAHEQPTATSRVYTAVTNAHVIQSSSAPFHVQTADGQIYAAALVPPPVDRNRDLTLLRFASQQRAYQVARLADASPKLGDRVWSAGFPLKDANATNRSTTNDPAGESWGIETIGGNVTQILPVAMSGGYSIGFDAKIVKGMSGGALIDRDGKLVGINGIHADPLWDTPDVLEDGSTVTDRLQQQINNYSWAIPIEFVKTYAKLR